MEQHNDLGLVEVLDDRDGKEAAVTTTAGRTRQPIPPRTREKIEPGRYVHPDSW